MGLASRGAQKVKILGEPNANTTSVMAARNASNMLASRGAQQEQQQPGAGGRGAEHVLRAASALKVSLVMPSGLVGSHAATVLPAINTVTSASAAPLPQIAVTTPNA
jgi:hypothetical protein